MRGAINSINLINYFASQRKCCYQFFLQIVFNILTLLIAPYFYLIYILSL